MKIPRRLEEVLKALIIGINELGHTHERIAFVGIEKRINSQRKDTQLCSRKGMLEFYEEFIEDSKPSV